MGISAKIKMGRKVRKKSQILSDLGLFPHIPFGGDKRDRTADLLNAIQALSQLSYTPMSKKYINRRPPKSQGLFFEIAGFFCQGRKALKTQVFQKGHVGSQERRIPERTGRPARLG